MLEKVFSVSYSKLGKKGLKCNTEHKKMKKTRYNRKFTLIEMLIVVGIASLLFALLGPAFTRMTQSNAVEQHASGLKLGMERARALAISQRRYVAMLLPHGIGTETDQMYKYQRGGYRFCYIKAVSSSEFHWDGWLPESNWENSGKQVAFLLDISTASTESSEAKKDEMFEITAENMKKNIYQDYLYEPKGVPGASSSYAAIIFTPYGDVKICQNEVELRFYITGVAIQDQMKLRLNKISGKVEFVE